MISAEKAREIQRAAQAEQDAYVRAVIQGDAEDACDIIARAARGRQSRCIIDASEMTYPKGVAEYLKNELGYSATYESHTISVAW